MGLGWIDDRNGDVRITERECKAHPIRPSGLHHDKNGSRIRLQSQELMVELVKAHGSLLKRVCAGGCRSAWHRGKGKGAGGHINADKEPIGTCLLEHITPLREYGRRALVPGTAVRFRSYVVSATGILF